MECKQCKMRIPKSSRSKVFIGYCRHCASLERFWDTYIDTH
jgi:Zn-finger nucleic acid-binding protein